MAKIPPVMVLPVPMTYAASCLPKVGAMVTAKHLALAVLLPLVFMIQFH